MTTKLEMDREEQPLSPLSRHGGVLRKMRRQLRGKYSRSQETHRLTEGQGSNRRRAAIFLLFATILVIFFHRGWHFDPWISTTIFGCSSLRSNPYHILPPEQRDPTALSNLWINLRKLFDEHAQRPAELPRIIHESDLKFPSLEQLHIFLKISDEEARATRDEHAAVVRGLPPYPKEEFSGRGVVMLAGGRYSGYAATSLGMLREVGSRLPVEVWMKDETEEREGWCAELETEGMACRLLSDYMDASVLSNPYTWKVFTMLFSSFEEVLFLDADDIPIKNPDFVFDSKKYQETGAILWPDYWKHTGSPWLPYIIDIADKQSDMLYEEKTVESGQIIWDKSRHWKV